MMSSSCRLDSITRCLSVPVLRGPPTEWCTSPSEGAQTTVRSAGRPATGNERKLCGLPQTRRLQASPNVAPNSQTNRETIVRELPLATNHDGDIPESEFSGGDAALAGLPTAAAKGRLQPEPACAHCPYPITNRTNALLPSSEKASSTRTGSPQSTSPPAPKPPSAQRRQAA